MIFFNKKDAYDLIGSAETYGGKIICIILLLFIFSTKILTGWLLLMTGITFLPDNLSSLELLQKFGGIIGLCISTKVSWILS